MGFTTAEIKELLLSDSRIFQHDNRKGSQRSHLIHWFPIYIRLLHLEGKYHQLLFWFFLLIWNIYQLCRFTGKVVIANRKVSEGWMPVAMLSYSFQQLSKTLSKATNGLWKLSWKHQWLFTFKPIWIELENTTRKLVNVLVEVQRKCWIPTNIWSAFSYLFLFPRSHRFYTSPFLSLFYFLSSVSDTSPFSPILFRIFPLEE